jgi:hypothetical protein
MLVTLTISCLSVSTRCNCWFQLSCIVSVSVFHAPFGCQLKRHPTWQWRLYNRIASLSCTCEEPREVGQLCEHADVPADSSLFSLLSRLLIGLHRLKTTTVRNNLRTNVHVKNNTENSTTPCYGTANMSDIVSCLRKKVGAHPQKHRRYWRASPQAPAGIQASHANASEFANIHYNYSSLTLCRRRGGGVKKTLYFNRKNRAKFMGMKVPVQCPLVRLVKVGWEEETRSEKAS